MVVAIFFCILQHVIQSLGKDRNSLLFQVAILALGVGLGFLEVHLAWFLEHHDVLIVVEWLVLIVVVSQIMCFLSSMRFVRLIVGVKTGNNTESRQFFLGFL